MYESVGDNENSAPPSSIANAKKMAKDSENVRSLLSLEQLASVFETSDAIAFQNQVLNYIIEWEEILTAKVDAELDIFRSFEEEMFHYETKVEALKKKGPSNKLDRNEEKLKAVTKLYEGQQEIVTILLQGVAENSWKDLYPLLQKTINWEANCFDGAMTTYGTLIPPTLEDMNKRVENELAKSIPDPEEILVDELAKQKLENAKLESQINRIEAILKGKWNTRSDIVLLLKQQGKIDISTEGDREASSIAAGYCCGI